MKKIAVFLFEGAELFEIATFTDIFGWNNIVGLKEFRDIKVETISYKESIKCTWGGELKTEKVITEENIEEFFATTNGNYYLLTKFGKKTYSDFDFTDEAQDHYFIFGRETTGLPDWVKDKYQDTALRIPMNDNIRSLNLSNTASLLIYEALRQQNFPSLY